MISWAASMTAKGTKSKLAHKKGGSACSRLQFCLPKWKCNLRGGSGTTLRIHQTLKVKRFPAGAPPPPAAQSDQPAEQQSQ